VIIARNDAAPVDFAHAHLFVPKPKPAAPPLAGNEGDTRSKPAVPVGLAQSATNREATSPEVAVPASEGAAPGGTAAAPQAASEPRKLPQTSDPPKPSPAAKYRAADQPHKRSGPLAIFISRKEKKIFVRQGFVPLFDMPVAIDGPDLPLGTHIFTAIEVTDDGAGMRWNAITLPRDQRRPREPGPRKKNALHATVPMSDEANATPEKALDRIHIPQEAVDRISELLIPGSSLVVSDQGLGPETGRGTDFIVVTR
jgi:hypothetical protein